MYEICVPCTNTFIIITNRTHVKAYINDILYAFNAHSINDVHIALFSALTALGNSDNALPLEYFRY